jgi:hypothetical protein
MGRRGKHNKRGDNVPVGIVEKFAERMMDLI